MMRGKLRGFARGPAKNFRRHPIDRALVLQGKQLEFGFALAPCRIAPVALHRSAIAAACRCLPRGGLQQRVHDRIQDFPIPGQRVFPPLQAISPAAGSRTFCATPAVSKSKA